MSDPTENDVFYASAIIVKTVDDAAATFFALDIEIAGGWISTEPLTDAVVRQIRLVAANPDDRAGAVFSAVHESEGSKVKFLVDGATKIRDEWSFV